MRLYPVENKKYVINRDREESCESAEGGVCIEMINSDDYLGTFKRTKILFFVGRN